MATKQQIVDLHARNPDWTAGRLARELNCHVATIRAAKRRYKLDIPREPTRYANPTNLLVLGKAARDAGLTLEMIQQMGA